MKTLIFRTEKNHKSRFPNTLKTSFVREGCIEYALTYFDGAHNIGNIYFDDETGEYKDDSGMILITTKEIQINPLQSIRFDIYKIWTADQNNLDEDEMNAVIEVADDWTISECLEANGYSWEKFIETRENGNNFDLETLKN